jgi:D-alanyl-D-alanine carboxypeptidase (penicillin-binding protein 5/6)
MLRLRFHIALAILPILALTFFYCAPSAQAIPVLKEQSKQSVRKTQPNRLKQKTIATLGSYRNISSVKQSVGSFSRLLSKFKLKSISAKSIMVIDSSSGRTLLSRSPDTPRQPASTIKILTGMIAIDTLKNKDRVPVSKKAAKQPRSKIYLDHRKTYQANDLINAVLLASANDASVALAEKIAGSERSFAGKMTALAKRWGARNTVCKTASGLTAKGQKSTARDLAIIFRQAMRDREFAARMKRTKARTTEGKLLRNHNKALWQIDGSLGGKTGYTNAARQTYVGKFRRGKDEIIIAIMGSESMWTDIKRLVDYGFARQKAIAKTSSPARQDNTAALADISGRKKS